MDGSRPTAERAIVGDLQTAQTAFKDLYNRYAIDSPWHGASVTTLMAAKRCIDRKKCRRCRGDGKEIVRRPEKVCAPGKGIAGSPEGEFSGLCQQLRLDEASFPAP